jgi:hypothetical protein
LVISSIHSIKALTHDTILRNEYHRIELRREERKKTFKKVRPRDQQLDIRISFSLIRDIHGAATATTTLHARFFEATNH